MGDHVGDHVEGVADREEGVVPRVGYAEFHLDVAGLLEDGGEVREYAECAEEENYHVGIPGDRADETDLDIHELAGNYQT